MIRTDIAITKIRVKKNCYITKYSLIVFINSIKFNIPLVFDEDSKELLVKYTNKTNAFILLKCLLRKVGFRNMNKYRWFKAIKTEYSLIKVETYESLITYLYLEFYEKAE